MNSNKGMDMKTTGKVVSVSKQWWLKVNTKSFRMGTFDGATFPHIIKVQYTVDGKDYFKRKWYAAGKAVPYIGERISVVYSAEKPGKAKII